MQPKRFLTFSSLARLVAAGLLFYALARHRYSYYTILRWITCSVALYSAVIAYKAKQTGWTWVLGVIAVFFNPFFLVTLDRTTWAPIDVITGVLLLLSILFVQESNKA